MDHACEHYNWNELTREVVRPGVERVGFASDKIMAVMNWLSPGMALFPHKHPFEQLVLILQGRVLLHIDGKVIEAGPGSMIRIPANALHHAEPIGEETVLNLDLFAPPRADYAHLVAYQQQADTPVAPQNTAQPVG